MTTPARIDTPTATDLYTAATIARALNELGIPSSYTPAPIANAIAILALERHRLLGHWPDLSECRHSACQPYR